MNMTNDEKLAVTADEVIRNRQADITKEVFDTDSRMNELKAEMRALEIKRARLLLEYDMWEGYSDRNQIRMVMTTTTIEVSDGRRKSSDRLPFEDCVRQIFDAAGRPLEVNEVIAALTKFGYVWNQYQSAYNYIMRNGNLTPTGQRGFYNIARNRGWDTE